MRDPDPHLLLNIRSRSESVKIEHGSETLFFPAPCFFDLHHLRVYARAGGAADHPGPAPRPAQERHVRLHPPRVGRHVRDCRPLHGRRHGAGCH